MPEPGHDVVEMIEQQALPRVAQASPADTRSRTASRTTRTSRRSAAVPRRGGCAAWCPPARSSRRGDIRNRARPSTSARVIAGSFFSRSSKKPAAVLNSSFGYTVASEPQIVPRCPACRAWDRRHDRPLRTGASCSAGPPWSCHRAPGAHTRQVPGHVLAVESACVILREIRQHAAAVGRFPPEQLVRKLRGVGAHSNFCVTK